MITDDLFKRAMGSFASGVTVITTVDSRMRAFGMTATAFCSVSKSPPLCLVCVAKDADAYPALKETGRFAVNLLSRTQSDLSARFATHGIDKFDGVSWTVGPETGCALIAGVLVSVECVVETSIDTGDHEVFVGAIRGVHGGTSDDPLVYFRGGYAGLVGGT